MDDLGTLTLSHEQMQALGYRIVDLIIEHMERLPEQPATRRGSRQDLEMLLREPLPDRGQDPLHVLERARRDVFSQIMHLDHPRFFGFIPSPSNFVGAMADAMAAGFNVFAGTWLESSGPAQVELVTIDWLRQACGLPEQAGGLFTSGGSAANLTALAAARQVKLGGDMEGAVVYCSDQTHASVDRGLRILGFRAEQLCRIEADPGFRLDLARLKGQIERDRAAGLRPFCVVANAGTTNTGAVDPLVQLGQLCREQNLWLHVDGAYGASAVFCESGRSQLKGLAVADSLTLDPHKWLFQPYEIGCLLVRDRRWLRETFQILAEYLKDIEGMAEEVNFCDYGPQLTRGFRAFELWMTFQVFGAPAVGDAIQKGLELAELAGRIVANMEGWRQVTPAQLGIVTFRCEPRDCLQQAADALNLSLVEALIADGFAMVSSTQLRGRTVLRMCTINPRTSAADIQTTLEKLDALSRALVIDAGATA
jgi:glutamate/tyrosine decarboxylase-like PLP-dependent enzyme